MKLLVKTNLFYLIFSMPVLILAGLISFFLITSEVKDSNYELLLQRKIQIEKYLNSKDTLAINFLNNSGEASVTPLDFMDQPSVVFVDTFILDKSEDELAPYQLLVAKVHTNDGNYLLKIWRSTIEFDELMEGIAIGLSLIFGFLLFVFLIINWWLNKTIWKPFYHTMSVLKSFSPSSKVKPVLKKIAVTEFHELNQSVDLMMSKMMLDFGVQKQFTENASHEMQTPLAVIRTKIDLLIQSENLGEVELNLILTIDYSISKLTRLNKALLLLTKLENGQFGGKNLVVLNDIISEVIDQYAEFLQKKNIKLKWNPEFPIQCLINKDLSSILIENLILNAIKHNLSNGFLEVLLSPGSLIISNSSSNTSLNSDNLFKRFSKDSFRSDSLGLGLAIAKEIAIVSEFQLDYRFNQNSHQFILIF